MTRALNRHTVPIIASLAAGVVLRRAASFAPRKGSAMPETPQRTYLENTAGEEALLSACPSCGCDAEWGWRKSSISARETDTVYEILCSNCDDVSGNGSVPLVAETDGSREVVA